MYIGPKVDINKKYFVLVVMYGAHNKILTIFGIIFHEILNLKYPYIIKLWQLWAYLKLLSVRKRRTLKSASCI